MVIVIKITICTVVAGILHGAAVPEMAATNTTQVSEIKPANCRAASTISRVLESKEFTDFHAMAPATSKSSVKQW